MNIEMNIDELFKKLEKDGHNTIDNMIKWMKEAKILEKGLEAEEKARKLFQEQAKQGLVSLEAFKSVLTQFGAKNETLMAEMKDKLQKGLADVVNLFTQATETSKPGQPTSSKK